MKLTQGFASESLTVAGTAVGFTATTYDSAVSGLQAWKAVVTVESAPIRFWANGTTPTAALGHYAAPGAVFEITGDKDVRQFLAIRTTSTSATLRVSYER